MKGFMERTIFRQPWLMKTQSLNKNNFLIRRIELYRDLIRLGQVLIRDSVPIDTSIYPQVDRSLIGIYLESPLKNWDYLRSSKNYVNPQT